VTHCQGGWPGVAGSALTLRSCGSGWQSVPRYVDRRHAAPIGSILRRATHRRWPSHRLRPPSRQDAAMGRCCGI